MSPARSLLSASLRAVAAASLGVLGALAFPAPSEESAMPDSIQDVKRKHEAELMAMRGVVSVGVGRDEQGQPVIVVGVDRERRSLRARLPERLEGYGVRAEVVGTVKAR
jgi:hypothetical protein